MSFSAIVVSHANETGLRKMLGNLMYQTRKPDETIVLVSGLEPSALVKLREDFHWVDAVLERPNLNDWGHEKRAEGIELVSEDWLGFFNDDDSYDLTYLEKMLEAGRDADAVYCGWNTIPQPRFRLGSSTSGNYIVRSELARQVGYHNRDYSADGWFINAVADSGARVEFVGEILYHHNVQR